MRWVTAKQLEDWAGSIGSEIELPKIVSDLIQARLGHLMPRERDDVSGLFDN